MADWHYDLFLLATGPLDAAAIADRLNRELPALPSPSLKLMMWGSAAGDRIDLWTDHSPFQLLARFDLRTPSDHFRRSILALANEFQLRLVNANDIEVGPTEDSLLEDINLSAAAEFVRDPPAEDDEEEAN